MRCGFCQPVSEYASSLRNGRRPFRNDELHQTTNWKSLLTCVAPGPQAEVERARTLLQAGGPMQLDAHANAPAMAPLAV